MANILPLAQAAKRLEEKAKEYALAVKLFCDVSPEAPVLQGVKAKHVANAYSKLSAAQWEFERALEISKAKASGF